MSAGLNNNISNDQGLSEEEFGNLLSSFGNHEAKSNLVRIMVPNIPYTDTGLKKLFMESQGQHIGWDIAGKTLLSYCSGSFLSIGVVVNELFDSSHNVYGYAKTQYGQERALPLAGLLLDFSNRYDDISLLDVFGSTQSPSANKVKKEGTEQIEFKKRSPILRARIFEALTKNNLPMRETDLSIAIKEKEDVVFPHLRLLERAGLIEYSSIRQGEPFVYYKYSVNSPATPPEPYSTYATLTNTVYELIKSSPDFLWSIEDIYSSLLKERKDASNKTLKPKLTNILTNLYSQGYTNLHNFSQRRQTEINLTQGQKEIIIDLLSVLEGYRSQDEAILNEGRKISSQFSQKDIGKLMQKVKESSSNANQSPFSETSNLIIGLIEEAENLTATQIRNKLEELYDKNLSVKRIQQILFKLKNEGKIFAGNQKTNISWKVK